MVTFFNLIFDFFINIVTYIGSSWIGLLVVMLMLIGVLFGQVYLLVKGGY